MKLHWFTLSLMTVVALSSPVKANTSTSLEIEPSTDAIADVRSGNNNADGDYLYNVPDVQEIKVNPPETQLNYPTPAFNPTTPAYSLNQVVRLGKEMSPVNAEIRSLMNRYKFLSAGMFFVDLQTGEYIDINGDRAFSAASTIKFPILMALFQEIEAGRVSLSEPLVMRRGLMVGGSGNMSNKPAGTKFTVSDTVNKMMIISDNTATNMIIERLGGKNVLNQRFRSWGLQSTVIRNWLVDEKGTNTTSAKDLVQLSALLANNKLVSDRSRLMVMDIMRQCHNRSMLPAGLGSGAVIAHKTGTLRFVLGDAGIIQTPSGKTYLAGIMVRRPNHDRRATSFIRQVSQLVYNYQEGTHFTNLPPVEPVDEELGN
ncbi:serine hydrolase [Merismopedia glauca]|uniref:Serine hydrolase n=1 Tax=Merismopedia glauca CCAP 1448/3 TaxID=1296344 RepID=A0A2T1C189_9CYAN|nr:serine hydrolase [Merismopedia glauca]PSB01927.1 serine hydrolase [Merismopedia glauca CCAP 1448/3]